VILPEHCSNIASRLGRVVGIRNCGSGRFELGLALSTSKFALAQISLFSLLLRAPPEKQCDQDNNNEQQDHNERDQPKIKAFRKVLIQIGLQ